MPGKDGALLLIAFMIGAHGCKTGSVRIASRLEHQTESVMSIVGVAIEAQPASYWEASAMRQGSLGRLVAAKSC